MKPLTTTLPRSSSSKRQYLVTKTYTIVVFAVDKEQAIDKASREGDLYDWDTCDWDAEAIG